MASTSQPRPPPAGLPILSGKPPITESSNCRQCGKEFNFLFRRGHACGHCGYEYCGDCMSDGQALMPRRPGQPGMDKSPLAEFKSALGLDDKPPAMNGYEVESVCTHCLSMLQVTAAPLNILRSLPLKRLKDYLAAYDIQVIGPKEKEDFVQAVVKARNPSTGCLSPEAESYYRRKSVPKFGGAPTSNSAPTPRRNPNSNQQARPSPPRSTPPPSRPPPPHHQYRPPPPQQTRARPPPPQNRPQTSQTRPPPPTTPIYRPPPGRPPTQSAPTPPARQPSPPVPTILSLVSLPESYLSSLSIGTLKAILYENHVKVDFSQVLEKNELVKRVSELVKDERRRLERQKYEEDRLAAGTTTNGEATPRISVDGTDTPVDGTATPDKIPTGPMPDIERGLCVVCQDEEATLAVVDCGHLCMCAHCSDLIMATSQECPLCRTRIVTKQRLIRIFRV